MAGKGYIFTKTSQMTSIGAIFISTYHTKQLNPWPNSSASCVVNYSRLSACQGEMEPFEADQSTHGRLTSLRNKPQQKQPRQLSVSIHASIVSQCIQLSFDGEKCVLLLCAWKASFLKSGHILGLIYSLPHQQFSLDSYSLSITIQFKYLHEIKCLHTMQQKLQLTKYTTPKIDVDNNLTDYYRESHVTICTLRILLVQSFYKNLGVTLKQIATPTLLGCFWCRKMCSMTY